MAIDIRATVTCSLGTLISGSISDDYLQGSGLVKTKASCEISGLITPAVGTVVTFSYVKGGVTRSIPRKLRVLSSFADPFRRTTKVELGCKLSYLSDLKEPIKWDAFDDPENEDYTEEDDKIITIPIYAGSVMVECLSKLGITASSIPLTNAFSISQFDFSGGYVQVLSDLLVSESYFGYLDTNEVLQVRNLAVLGGTGPVFTSTDIVDLGPIGVGQLPGEAVTVSYSTLKLKEPSDNEEDTEKLNWEEDETIGLPTTIRVDNPFFNNNPFPFPVPQYFNYNYIPRSKTITKYDDLDRVTTRTTTEYTIVAAIAPGYVQHIAGSAPITGPSSGSVPFTIVTTERITYAVSALDADPKNPPEKYEEVTEQTVTIEEPVLKLNASTTLYDIAGNLNVAINYGFDDAVKFVAEKSSTKYEYATNVKGAQVAKVLTRKSLCHAYTQEGQQELATYFQSLDSEPDELENDVIPTLIAAEKLKDLGTEIQISIGREIGLQQRPGSAELTNAKYADGGDPNNGWRVDSNSELELALGSATAQRRIEFSLPYAPDDRFLKITVGGEVSYLTFPSDAPAKANRYGRVQNRLLLGNRSGVNLQVAPEKLPVAPFEPLYLKADGLTALYRANGNQWAFDSNGIVCSTDALFWAAVSGTGTFWFPVAPGVTTLPAEPEIVDGEMNANTIVLPYNETASYDARLRVGMVVSKFDYALQVLTAVPALALKMQMAASPVTQVSVPVSSAITLSAEIPVIGEPVIESLVTTLYTGNSSTQTITGLPWSPSLVWIKQRNGTGDHFIFDIVRGAPKYLRPNLAAAESAGSSFFLTSFNSDGFTMGGSSAINDNNDTFVAWSLGPLSSSVTNTQGTITSTVRSCEFYSIVDFLGNGTAGATVGHGLSYTPTFIIVKVVASATGHYCGGSLFAADTYMLLSSNSGTTSSTAHLRSVSSTTVTLGANTTVNLSGGRAIMYAFCDVPGLCKGGTYTGTGDEAGLAVDVGFAPQFLLVKRRSGTGGWNFIDVARNLGTNQLLTLDGGGLTEEVTVPEFYQLTSTGFVAKRGTLNSLHDLNISGATYIYLAFGKVKPTAIAPLTELGLAAELPSVSAT